MKTPPEVREPRAAQGLPAAHPALPQASCLKSLVVHPCCPQGGGVGAPDGTGWRLGGSSLGRRKTALGARALQCLHPHPGLQLHCRCPQETSIVLGHMVQLVQSRRWARWWRLGTGGRAEQTAQSLRRVVGCVQRGSRSEERERGASLKRTTVHKCEHQGQPRTYRSAGARAAAGPPATSIQQRTQPCRAHLPTLVLAVPYLARFYRLLHLAHHHVHPSRGRAALLAQGGQRRHSTLALSRDDGQRCQAPPEVRGVAGCRSQRRGEGGSECPGFLRGPEVRSCGRRLVAGPLQPLLYHARCLCSPHPPGI